MISCLHSYLSIARLSSWHDQQFCDIEILWWMILIESRIPQIKYAIASVRNVRGLPFLEDFQRRMPDMDMLDWLQFCFGFQVLLCFLSFLFFWLYLLIIFSSAFCLWCCPRNYKAFLPFLVITCSFCRLSLERKHSQPEGAFDPSTCQCPCSSFS